MTVELLCFTREFLERCEAVTRKYEQEDKWTVGDQMLKIFEEVAEVVTVARRVKKQREIYQNSTMLKLIQAVEIIENE